MANPPKVFISYSHDSSEHKQWVSELAANLRRNGIDAILDQWDLRLGDDITRFMERGIVESDRVLIICTDKYVNKANADEGGVGYERMIVNAELVQNLGTDKFIPIIRQASGKEKTPVFLGTRVYADFRNNSQFDAECKKLIHELHEMPIIDKPPLGKNAFPSAELDPQLIEIPEHVESASEAYKIGTMLARAGDVLGWRELVKDIRPTVFKNLVQWRENELNGQKPESKEQLVQIVDRAVEIISPLMAVALVGIESGREEFRNQKSLIDDLQNIVGWNPAGYEVWIQLPNALGYVYHSLHGCVCMSTSQIDLALGLARVKIPDIYNRKKVLQVWEMSELVGWPKSLGPDCVESWKYLVNAYERKGQEWLSTIFESTTEYKALLVAYYMALNIHELAAIISSNEQSRLRGSYTRNLSFHFNVPLTFMSENQEIFERARSLLLRNPDAVTELWTMLNVKPDEMRYLWEHWVNLFEDWLSNVYSRYQDVSMQTIDKNVDLHRAFFEKLRP